MAASIQFRGKDRICTVYKNKSAKYWSLWQGSQFLERGEGSESLSDFLTMLEEDGARATYTLRIYEAGDSIGAVKSRTDFDGSYNFTLHNGIDENSGSSNRGVDLALHRRNWELEQEIKDIKRDRDSKKINAIGMITEALGDPVKLGQYINVIRGLLGKAVPSSTVAGLPARTFAQDEEINEEEEIPQKSDHKMNTEKKAPSAEDMQRLGKAIDILEENDPRIIEHLEKLAHMAVNNKFLFNMLLSQLDKQ